jgi:ubiquinone/menaquinone biosynthesis C-methylase UbiE
LKRYGWKKKHKQKIPMSNIKEIVKENYAGIVKENKSNGCCGPTCCGPEDSTLTEFSEDYSNLEGYVQDADFGLGCGIPTSGAGIKEGHTVLDLGSGAGNDVFVARAIVGETGNVIGVDFTPEMVRKANENKEKLGFTNVQFVLGDIESLPFQEKMVDVVISNCVLNLVEDKRAAYSEVYRVLKTGGHFSISDVVVTGPLSKKMQSITELYAGCIGGAIPKEEYLRIIKEAGFTNVEVNKERVISLPEGFLSNYLTADELEEYRKLRVEILSITVTGHK